MRTLTLHFPDDALPPFDTFAKQTREARVCRRAQAVREVVKGQRLHTVSDALSCTSSALRQWGYRFANHGTQGFVERPRSGRPPKITCALAQPLQRLVAQAPLQPGSLSAPWSCRELAPVLAQQTGGQLGRESVRCALKKRIYAPTAPPGGSPPPRPTAPMALSHSLPWSPRRAGATLLCSPQMKRSCGASRCPARAGGVKPHALASPPAR